MKKTVTITSIVVGILFILFLSLPYLVSNPGSANGNAGAKNEAEQNMLEPQIFTSNPLAKLVQRLARLFKKQPQTPANASADGMQLAQKPADTRFNARRSSKEPSAEPGSSDLYNADEADENSTVEAVSYSGQDNEWVLIEQIAPEGSAGGMHEISVKDNPFDRYEKYERAARYTPGMYPNNKEQDVPDSKLARFFQPITQFFGLGADAPAAASADVLAAGETGAAAKTGKSEMLDKDKAANKFSQFNLPNAPATNTSLGNLFSYSGQDATTELLNLIHPQRSLSSLAEMVAESKYPDPKDNAKKQKEKAEKQAEYERYVSNRLQERLVRLAEGKEAPDMIANVLSGCSVRNAFIGSSGGNCSAPDESQAGLVKQLSLQNRMHFFEEVQLPLPKASVLVVLSKADPNQPIQIEQDSYSKEDQLITEKYQFMLKHKPCSAKNPCYWVGNDLPANAPLQEERLADTVNASGVQFTGYKNKQIKKMDQDFVREQLDKLPENATPEQQQETLQAAQNAHTPYILLNTEELREIQKINKNLLRQGQEQKFQDTKDLIQQGRALYAGSAQTAYQLSQDLGEPYVFYGQNNQVLDVSQNTTLEERSGQLTEDIIDSTRVVKDIIRDLHQMANREALENQLKPAVEKINKETKEQQKEFEKTGKIPVAKKF